MTLSKITPDSDYLTDTQVAQLLRAINPRRVGTYEKNSKLTLAHVEAYELRAHLNRILGFARWSEEVVDQQMCFESSEIRRRKNNKGEEYGDPYESFTVVYRCIVRLTICAPNGNPLAVYTEGATGDAQLPSRADAHDMALKTSESQAFKRCCANLGDQFGLSLYRKGSMASLVKQTLLMPDVHAADEGVDDEVDQSVPESEAVEPAPDPRVTNASPSALDGEGAADGPAVPGSPAPDGEQQGGGPAVETGPSSSPDSAEKQKEQLQREANRIRQAALDGPPDGSNIPTPRWISRLMNDAMKGNVLRHRVDAFDSTQQVELKAFLEGSLSRAAGHTKQAQARERSA